MFLISLKYCNSIHEFLGTDPDLHDKLRAHPLALHHLLNTSLLYYCGFVKRVREACVHHVSIQAKHQEALPNSSILECLSNTESHTELQNIIVKDPSWSRNVAGQNSRTICPLHLSQTQLPRLQGAY